MYIDQIRGNAGRWSSLTIFFCVPLLFYHTGVEQVDDRYISIIQYFFKVLIHHGIMKK